MFTIIITALFGLSFITMTVMIFGDHRRLSGSLFVSSPSMSGIIAPTVSTTAHGLLVAIRQLIKYLSIRLLLVLHTLAVLGRTVLTRIERRFSLLIDAVRGRGQTSNNRHRGSVSFFLEQIKDYKEEMSRRANLR